MQCAESSVFQQHCHKVIIEKLKLEDIETFRQLDEDQDRIKLLYSKAQTVPITVKEWGKSYEEASKSKANGNSFFGKKDYGHALASYNSGILKCPQDEGTPI